MRATWIARTAVAVVMSVVIAGVAFAQEATISGTVKDSSGAVLPGVTVIAVHTATGNEFVAATGTSGDFRLPVRTGSYTIRAELQGFATLTATGIDLQVGQAVLVNMEMRLSTIQETVTVTGESPLIDVSRSRVAGNVDTRQMQDLPVNGRNWLDLALLAPGVRANANNEFLAPLQSSWTIGTQQINLDGQQVTSTGSFSSMQARFSRDAIAELEVVTNQFDASQGRASLAVVNAVTKAGTNQFAGTLSGYFRDDKFNAVDFVANRVLPYSNQQVSTTFGGPVRKDRMHFFAYYDGTREPQTFVFTSPYQSFNNAIGLTSANKQHMAGGRVDTQFSPQARLMVRGNRWKFEQPYSPVWTGGATRHPSAAGWRRDESTQVFSSLTQVFGQSKVNEIKGGFSRAGFEFAGTPADHPVSLINLRAYTLGTLSHNWSYDRNWSLRDDFTMVVGGRHELKMGAEYLGFRGEVTTYFGGGPWGTVVANSGAPPANVEQLFPVWNDPSTWNINALAPITTSYTRNFGNPTQILPRAAYGAWFQDNWRLTDQFTLNLGLRYDVHPHGLGENLEFQPWQVSFPTDKNNLAPRVGFVYAPTTRTAIRGGWGRFFEETFNQGPNFIANTWNAISYTVFNDGRPDFPTNPYNGPVPTADQLNARFCYNNGNAPGCIVRDIYFACGEVVGNSLPCQRAPQVAFANQGSVGVQHQFAGDLAVVADYVYKGSRHLARTWNVNISQDPVTGLYVPFSQQARRPYPTWGALNALMTDGYSNYHALQTAITKRFSHRWQGSATYTLSQLEDVQTPDNIFNPDTTGDNGDYANAVGDQRHRVVFNGIWSLPYGVQLSGLYHFGSGERFSTSTGVNAASNDRTLRLRTNGTLMPRNNLVGEPIHRVDLRLMKNLRLPGTVRIDGMIEVFNVFNHENFGAYATNESAANFGQPTQNLNMAYQPRMLQLGFRMAF